MDENAFIFISLVKTCSTNCLNYPYDFEHFIASSEKDQKWARAVLNPQVNRNWLNV